jgi:hypothetical protein
MDCQPQDVRFVPIADIREQTERPPCSGLSEFHQRIIRLQMPQARFCLRDRRARLVFFVNCLTARGLVAGPWITCPSAENTEP